MDVALPQRWRRWVAENVMLGVPDEQIVAEATSAGMDGGLICSEIQRSKGDPYIEAGRRLAQKGAKLESMLQVRVEVARQSGARFEVPVRSGLDPDEFREQYYARNVPVKILDMIGHWPAMDKWNPAYFRAAYGGEIVEVVAGRNSDPKYEVNLDSHRRQMRLADFIDAVVSGGAGNDSYLVANNHFFERPGLTGVLDDIGPLDGYLRQKDRARLTYLWMGPGGTITQLHHDTMNILFCQIYGSKSIRLIHPDESPWLYNEVGVYSEVDLDNPDWQRYPLFRHVSPVEVVVNPGDILFVPVGWWHYVRSLGTSISVSTTNFVFANDYHWRHPDLRENP